MKQFFSLTYFKELKVLLILELLLLLDLSFLFYLNEAKLDLFNLHAFLVTLSIWGLCSFLDKEKYFNFASLIATGFITYLVFWFMFNIIK